jgi:hypothetical protein
MSNGSKPHRLLAGAIALLLLIPAAAANPPKDKGKAKNASVDVDVGISATISAGISIGEARQIASGYELTGMKPLPPGIRKNLARGKPMPPGIAKTRLPEGFVSQLPRHDGYEWQRAGADLVLVASGSLVISDILEGVFD